MKLRWHKYLKMFFMEYKDLLIMAADGLVTGAKASVDMILVLFSWDILTSAPRWLTNWIMPADTLAPGAVKSSESMLLTISMKNLLVILPREFSIVMLKTKG